MSLTERLRSYRSRNEWGDPVEHAICDEAAATLERVERERDEALAAAEAWERKAVERMFNIVAAEAQVEAMRKALEKIQAAGAVVYNGESFTNEQANLAAIALSAPVEERKGDMVSRDHEPTLRALLEDVPPVLAALINRYGYHADNVTPKDWSEWNDARQLMAQTHAALASSTPESSSKPEWRPGRPLDEVADEIVKRQGRHAFAYSYAGAHQVVRSVLECLATLPAPAEARSVGPRGDG